MAKTDFKSVEEYIASQPEARQSVMKQVREAILKGLPKAEETISYQMPTYKLQGKAVIYFSGWKNHYSLYPVTSRMIAEFKDELAPYEIEKGTMRFSYAEPVPVKLIARIAKFRANDK